MKTWIRNPNYGGT